MLYVGILPLLLFALDIGHCDGLLNVIKVSDGRIITYRDRVKLQNIPFDKRHVNHSAPTSVRFNISSTSDLSGLSVTWYRDADVLETKIYEGAIPSNPGSIYTEIVKSGSAASVVLHLTGKELIPGNYTLVAWLQTEAEHPGSASAFVMALPILPMFPKERRVLEGDRLNVLCSVSGYPMPSEVKWRFSHIKSDLMQDPIALEDAAGSLSPTTEIPGPYQFETSDVKNDTLYFESLPKDFSGLYECSVGTEEDGDRSLILVNVKDRWAALWPFIGIVIEVSVLVAAILLYERHQMRSKPTKTEVPISEDVPTAKQQPAAQVQPQQQQQQSNVAPVRNNGVEVTPPEGNKPNATQNSNMAQDDLRQRMAPPRA